MSVQPQTKRPVPELDAEQEIDFGRYWRALLTYWWLPLVGIVAGAVIGYLVTLGGSSSYKATAQVYLGQPLAPGGGAPVSSAPTNLGLVSNALQSEATIRTVAAKVGLKPSRLRGHVTTRPIAGITGAKVGTPAPLLAITVTGSPPHKLAAAGNALAKLAADSVSGYSDVKIQQLKEHLAYDARELKSVVSELDSARRQQQAVASNERLSATERLVALANFNSFRVFNEQRRAALEQDQFAVRQLLRLAEDVERGRVVQPAVAVRTAGPSRGAGALIGAFIGLIVGIIASLVWEPVTERLRMRPA